MAAIPASYGANLRSDDGRLAVATHRARVEPVPASPGIGGVLLPREQNDKTCAIRELGDARALRELLRRLLAPMAQHDQRRAAPGRAALGHVHHVLAAPRPP